MQLLVPEDGERRHRSSDNLLAAIKTILIADLVMSLDNVIGVAAAAKGSLTLLVLGLAISIPLVIFGSTVLMKLMDRFPVIITVGAALLGWVAGEMAGRPTRWWCLGWTPTRTGCTGQRPRPGHCWWWSLANGSPRGRRNSAKWWTLLQWRVGKKHPKDLI